MSFGVPVQYLMLRGFFTTPGATPEQVAYYVDLLQKVRALPEWKDFMAQGAFKQTTLSGDAFVSWLDRAENFHRVLMREAKMMYSANTAQAPVAPAPPTHAKKQQ
jgi:tripartite-type tricarboxylate transporter receptor subunit TctC